MALNFGRAVGRGARRAASISGIVALSLTVLYQLLLVGSLNTVVVDRLPPTARSGDVGAIGFTLPVSGDVAAALGLVAFLFGVVTVVVSARLLARDLTALSSIPGELFTRRIGRAFLSTLLVSVAFTVVLPIGFVLLFVPGLFLAVSLQFAIFAVAVEDTGPVDAFRRSWDLATGNRWRLLALLVLFAVLGGAGGALGSLFALAAQSGGQIASLLLNSALIVLMYAMIADAFVQLRGGQAFGTAAGARSL
jgi:hypothetical protein